MEFKLSGLVFKVQLQETSYPIKRVSFLCNMMLTMRIRELNPRLVFLIATRAGALRLRTYKRDLVVRIAREETHPPPKRVVASQGIQRSL